MNAVNIKDFMAKKDIDGALVGGASLDPDQFAAIVRYRCDLTLVLLRHGQSKWNLENLFTGWTDVGLTETGVEEARKAGRLMAAEGSETRRDVHLGADPGHRDRRHRTGRGRMVKTSPHTDPGVSMNVTTGHCRD